MQNVEIAPSIRIAENRAEYGSFKDSMKAPVHQWFMYPAGFSYRLVEEKLKEYRLGAMSTVLDPFVGCGTTSVVAKQNGVNSLGIEAHPFVLWVAKTKLFWEYDLTELIRAIEDVCLRASESSFDALRQRIEAREFPALVVKCFSPENLVKLLALREAIRSSETTPEITDFLNLALTHTLRTVSWAGTGWPYIAPSKYHAKTTEHDAFIEFRAQAWRMYEDVTVVRTSQGSNVTTHQLLLHDARMSHPEIRENSVDLVITSPPYLNNYDYADRTRLELYFFGWASTWGDITEKIRSKLMMAATTQVTRSSYDHKNLITEEMEQAAPRIYQELTSKVRELSHVRLDKGGKKSYDIMVAGYFNDIWEVLKQIYRVLKPGCDFALVLGDSAPYSVYIPTDLWIGQLALSIGFSGCQVELLRTRGDKWPANTQRHKVGLRESIVTLSK